MSTDQIDHTVEFLRGVEKLLPCGREKLPRPLPQAFCRTHFVGLVWGLGRRRNTVKEFRRLNCVLESCHRQDLDKLKLANLQPKEIDLSSGTVKRAPPRLKRKCLPGGDEDCDDVNSLDNDVEAEQHAQQQLTGPRMVPIVEAHQIQPHARVWCATCPLYGQHHHVVMC
ncbi:hypothetical protein HaLaN_13251 [Haematococcus lacustris]|uniref:Uncharacterized protein n=1 Tax=Haematococcus lacustris TaxID=44745 RepID=A0A699ZLV7_HAELA|nr:hypothetical protein HaLaN_13251 [Haematococcus lacustris]